MEKTLIHNIYSILPQLLMVAQKPVNIDYDEPADTLYVSFETPQNATDTIPYDDYVFLREKNGKLVGLTIINASKINE